MPPASDVNSSNSAEHLRPGVAAARAHLKHGAERSPVQHTISGRPRHTLTSHSQQVAAFVSSLQSRRQTPTHSHLTRELAVQRDHSTNPQCRPPPPTAGIPRTQACRGRGDHWFKIPLASMTAMVSSKPPPSASKSTLPISNALSAGSTSAGSTPAASGYSNVRLLK